MNEAEQVKAVTVDSLARRYGYKMAASGGSLLTNAVTQVLIVRGLGPKSFGDFTFLATVVQQFVGFVEMVSSMFFSTRLAQSPRDAGFVRFQFGFYALCGMAGVAGILFADTAGLLPVMFPGQERRYVYMAVVFALVLWLPQLLNRMTDAYGLTVASEIARMIQRALGLAIVYAMVLVGGLNLWSVFLYSYVVSAGLAVAFWQILRRGAFRNWIAPAVSSGGIRSYLRDFRQYSTPLVMLSVVALVAGLADPWILQSIGSSVEQGFFGLASQVAAVCFLFVGGMVPLLTREFSILHAEQDVERLASAFARFIPMFYVLAAALSCFAALHSAEIVSLLGGSAYVHAVPAVAVLSLYPIHQTQGQLTGVLLLATGETRLYSIVGIVFLLAGLPTAYLAVRYGASHGPGFSSAALAMKMVVVQVVAVNVQLYFATKRLGLRYRGYLLHQATCVGVLLVLTVCARLAGSAALGGGGSAFWVLTTSATLYAGACVAVAFLVPTWLGLARGDVARLLSMVLAPVASVRWRRKRDERNTR